MNIMDIVDTLDEMLDRGLNMPFTGGKALVDVDKLSVITKDLRDNLPREINQAKAVLAEREQILSTAKQEADAIVKRAEDRARALVAQQTILKQAQERARELTHKSETESSELRKASHAFTDGQLEATEALITKQLSDSRQVRNSLKKTAASQVKK